MPTEPRPVRLRSACDACNASKIKCSARLTGCDRCLSLNLVCHYSESRVGRVPGLRGRNRRREQQLQCEETLQSSVSPSDTSLFTETPQTDVIFAVSSLNPTPASDKEPCPTPSSSTDAGLWHTSGLYCSEQSSTVAPSPQPATRPPEKSSCFELIDIDNFSMDMDMEVPMCSVSESMTMYADADGHQNATTDVHRPYSDFLQNGLQSGVSPSTSRAYQPTLSPPTSLVDDPGHIIRPAIGKLAHKSESSLENLHMSLLPLIEVAHQLELHVRRAQKELKTSIGVIKAAVHSLETLKESSGIPSPDQKWVLMECVVWHQVVDLLEQAYAMAIHTQTSQHEPHVLETPHGQGLHNARVFETHGSTALVSMDEDDRRAMQVVVVQRQVKRASAAVQHIRRKQTHPPSVEEGVGKSSIDHGNHEVGALTGTAADSSGMDVVERRLMSLASEVRQYLEANI